MATALLNILDKVGRVFVTSLSYDKKHINFMEACDYWYDVDLDRNELDQLIHELTKLRKQMEVDKYSCHTCQNQVSGPCGEGCSLEEK